MLYGICNLGVIPLRLEADDTSEMVSQVLYGDHFKVIEKRKTWSKIRLQFDKYEGWIDNKQYKEVSKEEYQHISTLTPTLSRHLVDYISNQKGHVYPIPLGSNLGVLKLLGHTYEGKLEKMKPNKSKLIDTALQYYNSPYLWGGKTPFGIDCSGFTQMVYKLNGFELLRDASQQATQGEALSFIEESEAGDLAFFDNSEGSIIHVGLIMDDHHIIHAHGQVRIDRLDHSGIYNSDTKKHTHKLRVIKKIV